MKKNPFFTIILQQLQYYYVIKKYQKKTCFYLLKCVTINKTLAIWTIAQKYGKGSKKMIKDMISFTLLCLPEENSFPKTYVSFLKVVFT